MSKNECCVWDFTASREDWDADLIKDLVKEHCKAWCFQFEIGEKTGYEHYQGRVSLKRKTRKPSKVLGEDWHWSVTSKENRNNMFYVTKEDTRIDGPWADTDVVIEVPWQLEDITLRAWQQQMVDSAKQENRERRIIDCIINKGGNEGKTLVAQWCQVYGIGIRVPFMRKFQDIMQFCMSFAAKPLYIIDVPRAIKKEDLEDFWAGVEELKSGSLFDTRYHGKIKTINAPRVWIFTNKEPELEMLSSDRWRFWKIGKNYELKRYKLGTVEKKIKNDQQD